MVKSTPPVWLTGPEGIMDDSRLPGACHFLTHPTPPKKKRPLLHQNHRYSGLLSSGSSYLWNPRVKFVNWYPFQAKRKRSIAWCDQRPLHDTGSDVIARYKYSRYMHMPLAAKNLTPHLRADYVDLKPPWPKIESCPPNMSWVSGVVIKEKGIGIGVKTVKFMEKLL